MQILFFSGFDVLLEVAPKLLSTTRTPDIGLGDSMSLPLSIPAFGLLCDVSGFAGELVDNGFSFILDFSTASSSFWLLLEVEYLHLIV